MKHKILLVDDDIDILDMIEVLLENEGYEIIRSENGEEALQNFDKTIDLVILDVMMPGKSGYKVCREIRKKASVPILFLTAKTSDEDLVTGFSYGGDDYLGKPFSTIELIARVKALIRRYYAYKGKTVKKKEEIVVGELIIDFYLNKVTLRGKEVILTDIEYRILKLMASHRNKIFSAQNLYESVWEEPYSYLSNNTVMVHIRKLRVKIEDDSKNPKYIKTVWGRGYRIE